MLRSVSSELVEAERRTRRSDCHFRLAGLMAAFTTDDPDFRDRFLARFQDCIVAASETRNTAVWLEVTTSFDAVSARFDGTGCGSVGDLIDILHPELKHVKDGALTPGLSRHYGREVDGKVERCLTTEGPHIRISKKMPWQMMLSRIFLTHLMRLQPELLFFHGATVAVGSSGILLTGERGSGKSTLSLGLAARGHGFLGDEIAGVDPATRQIHPVRMQVAIRQGAQAEEVMKFIDDQGIEAAPYLDGSLKYCAQVSSMFPGAVERHVPLTDVFFLKPIASEPKVTRFEFRAQDLGMVAPLHGTLFGVSHAARLLSFLRLFSSVRCHILSPGGGPERTAGLIEEIVKGADAWAIA